MAYYITVKNELLEPKHVAKMGPAVWLYMWFIDKVMAINENGIGKVLNGRPVSFDMIEPVLGISERTYTRWVATLKKEGYIHTTRTPYGLSIYLHKAEKMWGQKSQPRNAQLPLDSSANSGVSKELKTPKAERSAKSGVRDTPNMAERYATNGGSNNNNTINNTKGTKTKHGAAVAPKSEIGSLYYKVIKLYDLPVTNNNVVWAKIKQWERDPEPEKAISYLNFLLTQYPALTMPYKPQISTALDIYSKRAMIRNWLGNAVTKSNNRKIAEV